VDGGVEPSRYAGIKIRSVEILTPQSITGYALPGRSLGRLGSQRATGQTGNQKQYNDSWHNL
jgi:hypothetical protein